MAIRRYTRWALGLIYAVVGYLHIAAPAQFVTITPHWVPRADAVVLLTGIAELVAAPALVQPFFPALRKAAGWGLAAYALCVWPANYNHMLIDFASADSGLGPGYHIPRLAAQPLFIWAALWASEAIAWPFGRRA